MNPKNSEDLFNKIRSQFSNIRLGDENGAATADPSSAVFFEFEFQEDADTFGSVSVSLADGENMKVYYNRDLVSKIDEDSRDEWYAFLKELKDFAVEHQLRFDVRDITKNNLTKQDYENLADTNKTVNTDEMSEELARITKLAGVTEGLTGTAKRSYENLNKTKLIIRHKGKVDETVPGARSRQIQSLYIENEDGERFKYPLTHLAGARAMMRHVSNGGRPHDEFGEHIVRTSEDIAKLNSFSRYVTNKDQLNDNAGDIIEQTKLKLENLRGYMKNLSNQAHYENASKDFKTSEEQILDDETVNKMREKFTMTNLDSRVEDALPLINRIMSELENTPKEEEQVNELEPDAEPIDAPVQAPVDHGAVVQSFLNDPDSKLVLRKDDSADKMLKVTKFTNKNTMLSSILSDIASRLLTKSGEEDRVANFASRVADEMEQENSATFKATPDYIKNKKIAVQLAKRYIDDYKKMQSEPGYTDQVRMDPADFNPKKDLKGKAKETEAEAFESWVDETVNEYAKPIDLTNKGMFKTPDEEKEKKLDVSKADKMLNTTAYKRMKAGTPGYTDKTNEGNQFAQAVQKAKAAGMKAGDKFKVGDDEYTLKDAIEMAGLQLEEFFTPEDNAPDMVIRDPDDEAEDKEQEIAKDQEEAEKINTELDRIKQLANI
jgi:ribosomal protein L17